MNTRPIFTAPLLLAAVLAACTTAYPPDTSSGYVPPDARVWVPNQDGASVTVVDAAEARVLQTVDLTALGYPADAKPHHVAVGRDGHWYVSLIGAGRVLKLDGSNRVVGEASFETPGMLAPHPTGDVLYVGRSMTAVNPPPRIGVIRTGSMDIDEVDVFLQRPHAMAVDRDARFVYTASLSAPRLAALDLSAEVPELGDIAGEHNSVMQWAVSPDGATLAGTSHGGTVLFYDLSDPVRPAPAGEVRIGGQPWHPTFSRDGSRLFVPNKSADRVYVIDVDARAVETTIADPRLRRPHGSTLTAGGTILAVSGNGADGRAGGVLLVDPASLEVRGWVETGPNAAGIGARPEGR